MLGRHQAVNASVALAVCGVLSRKGWRISESALRSGLARASCPARIEILSQTPPVVLDTAHNPASVAALLSLLEERFGGRPKLLLYAASHDKDSRSMLEQLLPHFDQVVLTRFLGNPRAAKPQQLLALAESIRATHHWSRPELLRQPRSRLGLAAPGVPRGAARPDLHHRIVLSGRRNARAGRRVHSVFRRRPLTRTPGTRGRRTSAER